MLNEDNALGVPQFHPGYKLAEMLLLTEMGGKVKVFFVCLFERHTVMHSEKHIFVQLNC